MTRTNLLSTKSYLRYSGGAIVNDTVFDATGKGDCIGVAVSNVEPRNPSF